jgi:hypothetical protein
VERGRGREGKEKKEVIQGATLALICRGKKLLKASTSIYSLQLEMMANTFPCTY